MEKKLKMVNLSLKTLTEERWLKIKNYKSIYALKAFVGFIVVLVVNFFHYAQKYTNIKMRIIYKQNKFDK